MAVIKHKDQRVGVFIDTQNLYHSARNLYQARVNFGAVVHDAVADRKLVRAIAYVITTESGEETNFFEALTKLGIEAKTKDLQVFFGGAKKADWDVGLAIDAVRLAPKLDAVVIASGDGDFIPLVEYLQNLGVQVEVVAFGKSASLKLKEAADHFIDLSGDPRKYLISSRGQGNGGRNNTPGNRAPRTPAAPSQSRTRKVVRKMEE
ncbi:MAG: LabA-like NYN domain-containing protein [Minisyncoccota bacterium]